jgi:hypothetical protein
MVETSASTSMEQLTSKVTTPGYIHIRYTLLTIYIVGLFARSQISSNWVIKVGH